jgi:HSP20 family molecular chaperone IbpA
MNATTLELMHDHVRAIYRAVTGSDLPEPEAAGAEAPSEDLVAQRFAELESFARSLPTVAERVPPFSFAPPLDAIGTEKELVIELAVPGVDRRDVEVELSQDLLVIAGSRGGERPTDGRTYFHAEIPRGPFRRVVRLPFAVGGSPRVEVEQGLIRVTMTRATAGKRAKA